MKISPLGYLGLGAAAGWLISRGRSAIIGQPGSPLPSVPLLLSNLFALGPRGTGTQVVATSGLTAATVPTGGFTASTYLPGSPTGAPSTLPPGQTAGNSITLNGMTTSNPYFIQYATQFRQNQCANGLNPDDWSSFRAWVAGLGAADPGNFPPPEWPTGFGGVLNCALAASQSPI